MTIRHLRIFLEVVRCGKMSLAAQKLYISQPTVSQAVAELERTYRVRLFERLQKKLYLTPEGELLLEYAQRVVTLFDEMEARLTDTREAVRLRIGATVTVGTCLIGELVCALRRECPRVDAEVLVDNTRAVEAGLLDNLLDVGLVEGRVHSSDLLCEPVIGDRLVVVCGAGHPLAARERVPLNDLKDEAFILREPGSGTRELFVCCAKEHGWNPRCQWVCNNSEAIKNAVGANLGLSVISRMLVEKEVRAGVLHIVELSDCSLERSFTLIYHKQKYVSEFLKAFLEICRRYDRESPPHPEICSS